MKVRFLYLLEKACENKTFIFFIALFCLLILSHNARGEIYSVESIQLDAGVINGISPNSSAYNSTTKRLYVININAVLSVIDGTSEVLLANIKLPNPSKGSFSRARVAVSESLNKVYVTDYDADRLVVIDGAANTVETSIYVGNTPRELLVHEATGRIYVSNYGYGQNPGNNTVTVINSADNTIEETITVGKNPLGIGVNSSNGMVYVANEGSGNASVIDGDPTSASFNTVVATIAISGQLSDWGTAMVRVNESTNTVYVLNRGNCGNNVLASVAVINSSTNTLITNVTLPDVCWSNSIGLIHDSNIIMVGNNKHINGSYLHTYSMIDGSNNSVTGTGPVEDVGNQIRDIVVNGTTDKVYLYVQDLGIQEVDIDPASPQFNHVTASIEFPAANDEAPGILAADENSNLIYALSSDLNSVGIIDSASDTLRQLIRLGSGAVGIAVDSIRNVLWVSHFGDSDGVKKIDGATHAITGITAGSDIRGIIFDEPGNWAYAYDMMTAGFIPVNGSDNSLNPAIVTGRNINRPAINHSTKRMYVPVWSENKVLVIDLDPSGPDFQTILASIPVGNAPEGIAVNETDNYIYVANNEGTVSAINGVTNSVVATITTTPSADQIVINQSTKKAYVSYDGAPVNGVKVIDTDPGSPSFNTVIKTIDLASQPEYLAVNESTNRIYVHINGNQTLGIINGVTDTVEAVINIPGNSEMLLLVNESLDRTYLLDRQNAAVHVINGSPSSPEFNTLIKSVSTGGLPQQFGMNKNTNKLYVANMGDNTISVLTPDDLDDDGYSSADDCDDRDTSVNPQSSDLCDGIDNDCNPDTPDGSGEEWYGMGCDGQDSDACMEGVYQCVNSAQSCSDTTGDDPSICSGSIFVLAVPASTPADSPGVTFQTVAPAPGGMVQIEVSFNPDSDDVIDDGEWVLVRNVFMDNMYYSSSEVYTGDHDPSSPGVSIRLNFNNAMFPPGEYIVKVSHVTGESATARFTIEEVIRPVTVTGTVYLEGTNTPVSQAFIYANQYDMVTSTYTNSDGTYTLPFTEPALYYIGVFKEGLVRLSHRPVTVPAAGLSNEDFYLAVPDAQISGTVIESGTGNPVGGAQVWTDNGDDSRHFWTNSDINGTYTLNVMSGDTWNVGADKIGYVRPTASSVIVSDPGIFNHNIILFPPDTFVTGTVTVYGTSEPVKGVEMDGRAANDRRAEAITDSSGQYTMPVLSAEMWRLRIENNLPAGYFGGVIPANNYQNYIYLTPTIQGPNIVDAVVHKETAWIEGTVMDEYGVLAVEGVTFRAIRTNTNDPALRNLRNEKEHISDSQGLATIGVEAGDWQVPVCLGCEDVPVRVGGQEREMILYPPAPLVMDIETGEHRTVPITAYYADCAIEGTVYLEDGVTPLANADIGLWSNNPMNGSEQELLSNSPSMVYFGSSVKSDANGRYRLPVIGGQWELNAVNSDKTSITKQVTCDPDGNDVIDQSGETISGVDFVVMPLPEFVSVIDTGLLSDVRQFGLSHYNNELYLTGYSNDELARISLAEGANIPGYPAEIPSVFRPHGIDVDDLDGTIWVCDLNNQSLRHYDTSLNLIESVSVGSQPVNAIIHQNTVYVADRSLRKIFMINKATLADEGSFTVTDMSSSGGYIDLFLYENRLYVAGDGIDGIIRMDLDGTNQENITIKWNNSHPALGIFILNDHIYLNMGWILLITDMSGNLLQEVHYGGLVSGFTGGYMDIEIVGNRIYIPSYWQNTNDTRGSHLMVFEIPASPPSLTSVQSFTETFANHPNLDDGWYLHLYAETFSSGDTTVTVDSLMAHNGNVAYNLNPKSNGVYKKHPAVTDAVLQKGAYTFTANLSDGSTSVSSADSIDYPMQLPVIPNLRVSDFSTTPTFTFDPLTDAEEYGFAVFDQDMNKLYKSSMSNSTSFPVPFGIMTYGNTYYMRAVADDLTDDDGDNDIENRSVNHLQFAPVELLIENPSFEQDVPDETWPGYPDGPYNSFITGWNITGSTGTLQPNTAAYPAGVVDGLNVTYVNAGGTVTQTLSEVLTEGYTYSLMIHVGNRADVAFPSYAVQLYAGDNLLAQDSSSSIPAEGEFLLSTVNYTAVAGDPNLGQPLEIRLTSSGSGQVNFDMVSLDIFLTTLDLTPVDDQTMDAGSALSVPITATDTDGNAITLEVQGLPSFASFTDFGDGTGNIEFSPGADVAPYYNLKVIARAGNSTLSDTFRLNINNTDGSLVFLDEFEVDTGDWEIDNGVWEIGEATSGPGSCYSGTRCAATKLSGNYHYVNDSYLISPPYDLPVVSGGERVELRFWHWYSYGAQDYGYVRVSEWDGTQWGVWETVSSPITNSNESNRADWTPHHVDLTAYAGKRIRIGFLHIARNQYSGADEGPGWFIDEVEIWQGVPQVLNPEKFENGWGNWYTSSGIWEIGVPENGPAAAHEGTSVAGTYLKRDYDYTTDSYLISPPYDLPVVSGDERVELRFWHWYSYGAQDYGYVRVSEWDGTQWGVWETVSSPITNSNESNRADWTPHHVDLTAYAGKRIRIGFLHIARNQYSGADEGPGWFIDEVEIWQGVPQVLNPEKFENGWGNWYTSSGIWEIGVPENGPAAAHEGTSVAGTYLKRDYDYTTDSYLISPPYDLPVVSGDERVELRFWHWYSYGAQDYGYVRVSEWDGTQWGVWETVSSPITNSNESNRADWTPHHVDLTAYAGKRIRIGFLHIARNQYSGADEGPGWFIDEVEIWQGVPQVLNPEKFENGWGNWYTSSGIWEIGVPENGPAAAHEGTSVAGTYLKRDYDYTTDSYLISPPYDLPVVSGDERVELRFWHWYSYGAQDYGYVRVSEWDGTQWGVWETVSSPITNSNESNRADWTPHHVDLTAYAGKRIRIGFLHIARNQYSGADEGPGWFIDEVEIWQGVPQVLNPEKFENGWGNWYTSSGIWEIGVPENGPAAAHEGTSVAGTYLKRDYDYTTDSYLISPPYDLPVVSGDERVELRFWHWYSYGAQDYGYVRVSEWDGTQWGVWETVSSPITNSNESNRADWTPHHVDLTAYAGKRIRIGFLHIARNQYSGADEGPGWFIDEVEIWQGVPQVLNPEKFENGWGNWYTSSGIWEIGVPENGPAAAHEGTSVAGTYLKRDYDYTTDSYLISPPYDLPVVSGDERVELRFWHWYSYGAQDYGRVEVSEWNETQWGAWKIESYPITNSNNMDSSDWTPHYVDLTAYAGKRIRIGFRHIARNQYSGADEGPGWFIDEVVMLNYMTANQTPELTPLDNQPVDEGGTLSVPISATDPEGDTITLSIPDLPPFCTLTDNGDGTGSVDCNPGLDDSGSYVITVNASDGRLTGTESFTLTVNNTNQPPAISPIDDMMMDSTDSLTIALISTDADLDYIILSAPELPSFCTFTDNGDGTGLIGCNPPIDASGPYNVTINASDGVLSDSEPFILTVNQVTPPFTVNFSADKTKPVQGNAVTFTDQSSGTPVSWQWDFDNDGTVDSIDQNPTHTYYLDGTYSVKLTVSDGASTYDHLKTNYIQVMKPLPDLQVTALTHSQAVPGQMMEVCWTVTNTGAGTTNAPIWYDRIWISPDLDVRAGQPEDRHLGTFENLTYLVPGQSYAQCQQVQLPGDIVGTYYLFMVTDNYDAYSINLTTMEAYSHGGSYVNIVPEQNERNNFKHTTFDVIIPPAPDLQVSQVIPEETVFTNSQISVAWTVLNEGDDETGNTQWTDRVYLSTDNVLDGNDMSLGTFTHPTKNIPSAGSDMVQPSFTVPHTIFGDYYVCVATDISDSVEEYLFENNNTACSENTVYIVLSPPPDLTVTDVTVDKETVSAGESVSVNWTVENLGPGETHESSWSDCIYLSRYDTFNSSTAQLLKPVPRSGKLAVDATYNRQTSVGIPNSKVGTYYIYVKTDCYNHVFEHQNEGNNVRRAVSGLNVFTPDLEPYQLSVSPNGSSGGPLAVSWAVENIGTGDLLSRSWRDAVYLSDNATLDGSDLELRTVSQSRTILRDGAYSVDTTVTLPNGISGDYYIFVRVDRDNAIFENQGESNNVIRSAGAVPIELSPWPDLQTSVTNVVSEITAGDKLPITFEVTNHGVADTKTGPWVDRIYLSGSPTWDGSSIASATFSQYGPMAASGDYSKTYSLKIPPQLAGGEYYIYTVTDANNSIYEHTDENNNVSSGVPFNVLPYPPVDLTITNYTADTTVSSGKAVNVSWTVENIGQARTLASRWDDKLFLSTDDILNVNEDIPVKRVIYSGGLAAPDEYTRNVVAVMPHGISGSYYLILMTDVSDDVGEDDETNNTAALPVTVELTPPPDLEITSFAVPSTGMSGQPIPVEWTVENTGTGAADTSSWYDGVYLSADDVLDKGDSRLKSVLHSGVLNPAGTYDVIDEVELPVYASGLYFILIKTDSSNDIYEHNAEDNNVIAYPIDISMPPPADLIVTDITVPPTASPGQTVTVSWTVQNQGAFAAVGRMREAVYISADNSWEYTDPMLGIITRDVNIEPGASLPMSMEVNFNEVYAANASGNITAKMPGVAEGDHYVAVWTDIKNNIRETDITNNRLVSVDTVAVTLTSLTIDEDHNENIAGEMQKMYYKVDVPQGFDMRVSLTSDVPEAWNELYVSYGKIPSPSDYDYAGLIPFAADQQALVPSTQAGTYYILVYVWDLPAGVTSQNITLLAELLPFSIDSITPDTGGSGGRVTCTLTGAGFRDTTRVFLRTSSGTLTEGKVVEFMNTMELKIRWDLTDVPLGTYDVVAENIDTSTADLLGGFTVETSTGMQIHMSQNSAASFRARARAPFTINFVNTGNVDIPYLNTYIFIPTYVEPISITNTAGLFKNSDYRSFPTVPAQDFEYAYNDENVEFNAIRFIAKDVSPGEVLHSTVVFTGYQSPEFPILIRENMLNVDEFLPLVLGEIESMRLSVLGSPGEFEDEAVILATDPDGFQDTALQRNYIDSGLIEADELNQYFNDHGNAMTNVSYEAPHTTPMKCAGANLFCQVFCFKFTPPFFPWCEEICGSALEECKEVNQPVDPNEIIGPEGYGQDKWVSKNATLPYQILFENDPDLATAAAQEVEVRQALDPDLDYRTVKLQSIVFGDFVITIPVERSGHYEGRFDFLDTHGVIVDVKAAIDPNTREVFWKFRSLDAKGLPIANPVLGFLPVNDPDTGNGEGSVNYTVRAKQDAGAVDIIYAQASIVFDNNDPVVTNSVTNTIDPYNPSSQVNDSFSFIDETTFELTWTGQDTSEIPGLAGFDIYVSDDGAPYELWYSTDDPYDNAAYFTGVPGHTYDFYSIARDNAGNAESAPFVPDVTVSLATICIAPDMPSLVSPVLGETDVAANVTLNWSGGNQNPNCPASYDVYLYTADTPAEEMFKGNQSGTSYTPSLVDNEHYFWYVVAQNSSGIETQGPTWEFDTSRPPVGDVVINNYEIFANTIDVSLSLSASDESGIAEMCMSNSPSCTAWEPYATSRAWTLDTGEGEKTVHAWYKDGAGNVNPAAFTDTIILDTIPPALTMTSPAREGSLILNDQNTQYTMTGSSNDTGSGVQIVEVSTNCGSSWHVATGIGTWTYTINFTADGTYGMQARVTDEAGNTEIIDPCRNITVGLREAHLVTIEGRLIQLDGNPFLIKGVGYSPTPIGDDPSVSGNYGDYFTPAYSGIYDRDLQYLSEMGANVVRLWNWDPTGDHLDFLDMAYNAGIDPIYVIAGFWINADEDINPLSPTNRRETIKADFREMVKLHKNHPAILMWAIGNELNAPWMYGSQLDDLFSLINEMAAEAHNEEGVDYHPVVTPLADIDLINTISSYDAAVPSLDLWGANVYRGDTFGTLFDDYFAVSAKPLAILEYGIDAFDHINGDEYENIGVPLQAEYARALWKEITANTDMCAGGTIMAYSDEWWKGSQSTAPEPECPDDDPWYQSTCGHSAGTHPDGHADEEWWGIMRTVDNGASPDVMEQREAYYGLQCLWIDSDNDGITDDGNCNRVPGDTPCASGETMNCDDNCPNWENPDQIDTDGNGMGDACTFEPGDCNGDHKVDAGDLTALVLEIFDGDGNLPDLVFTTGGSFRGTYGCDPNLDGIIDAGDLTCVVLTIFNGPGACGN